MEKLINIKNSPPGSPIILEWDDERAAFIRKDSTITVNWPKVGKACIIEPLRSLTVYIVGHRYEILFFGLCSGIGLYTLNSQKMTVLKFLEKIKELELSLIKGEIKFASLEELYEEVLSMAQNAIKQLNLAEKLQNLYSLEAHNLKGEALELNKLAYFQQEALKICEQQNSSSKLSNAKALEYLHKLADSEAQKSERISKLMGKLIRQQQGRIR